MKTDSVKLPPSDINAEKSVLGALLMDSGAFSLVAGFLKPFHFYHKEHEILYSCCVALFEKQKPIDAVTIGDELKAQGGLKKVGGNAYVAELVQSVPTSAYIEHYGRIIVNNYIKRRIIDVGSRTVEKAFEDTDDVKKLLDGIESEIFGLSQQSVTRDFVELKTVLAETFEALNNDERSRLGIPSGFSALDHKLSGLHKNNLLILAARPGVGKTSFALNIAMHVALVEKKSVGFFSLEMSKEELVDRLLVSKSDVEAWRLKTGKLSEADYNNLTEAMGELSEANIFIDDTPGASILEMRTKARRLKAEKGLDFLVVDYLQLADGGGKYESRTVEVSAISKGLKNLARELQIPVMALSQLNRTVENRTTKKPQLSDLRESGAIEQDADAVMFLYSEDDGSDLVDPTKRLIKLDIAKHRHGSTGEIELLFRGDKVSFYSVEHTKVGGEGLDGY
jgi:replicative DNA helicase